MKKLLLCAALVTMLYTHNTVENSTIKGQKPSEMDIVPLLSELEILKPVVCDENFVITDISAIQLQEAMRNALFARYPDHKNVKNSDRITAAKDDIHVAYLYQEMLQKNTKESCEWAECNEFNEFKGIFESYYGYVLPDNVIQSRIHVLAKIYDKRIKEYVSVISKQHLARLGYSGKSIQSSSKSKFRSAIDNMVAGFSVGYGLSFFPIAGQLFLAWGLVWSCDDPNSDFFIPAALVGHIAGPVSVIGLMYTLGLIKFGSAA